MAKAVFSTRLPDALAALIDAEAERSGRTRTQVILDVLARQFIGDDSAPAPRDKRAPKAPPKPAQVITGAQLKERDLSPRLKAAPSDQAGRGSGIVSGLDLPIGNTRAPMQKGAGKAKAKG